MEWNPDKTVLVGLKILFAEKAHQDPHTFLRFSSDKCEERRDTEPQKNRQGGTVELRDGLPKHTQWFSLTAKTGPRNSVLISGSQISLK